MTDVERGMSKDILIIQGHPDASAPHFCHALADSYRQGAEARGHKVEQIELASLDFPWLASEQAWSHQPAPEAIVHAQQKIAAAEHVVMIYPLWLGTMPALVKAFLEQTLRPGFAFDQSAREGNGQRLLKGKSARVIITMGMPGFFYRWFFRAHGYWYLKRNILKFCGFAPVRHCFVGLVGSKADTGRRKWLDKVRQLGERAA
jgi:putative NADPH-quinone reductase